MEITFKLAKKARIKLSRTEYRKLAEYVDDRDQWCLQCGATDTADPAHVIRRSQGGNDSPNNVIKLCRKCHYDYDNYLVELKPEILEMLKGEPERL